MDCWTMLKKSDLYFFNLINPLRPTEIIDVGANPIDGFPPYKQMLDIGICNLTGFEPQPSVLADLIKNKKNNENYLPYVLGNGEKQVLKICRGTGMTSLYEPDMAVLNLFDALVPYAQVIAREEVATIRLDDVEEIGKIDFLKIDIQGGELSVFQSGRKRLADAVVIQTEVSFVQIYKNQPSFGEIDLELRNQGFIPHCFPEIKKWPISPCVVNGDQRRSLNQLLEADIVYVRDFSMPEKLSSEQLKQLALISHYVYKSYDLTIYCLSQLQLRCAIDNNSINLYLQILRDQIEN